MYIGIDLGGTGIKAGLVDENYKIINLHPIEMSKVRQNEIFKDLENRLQEVNSFKRFYLNSTIEEIKESVLC